MSFSYSGPPATCHLLGTELCLPQIHPYVEVLTHVPILEIAPLGRWLKINWVIRGEPWSARTSTTKETSEFSLYNVKTMRKVAVCKPGRQPFPEPAQASTLILDFPASRTVWLNFCSWNFYGTPSWLIYHPTQSKSQSPSSSQRSPARSGLSCPQPLTLSELTTFGIS